MSDDSTPKPRIHHAALRLPDNVVQEILDSNAKHRAMRTNVPNLTLGPRSSVEKDTTDEAVGGQEYVDLINRLKFILDAPTGGVFASRKGSLTRHDIRTIIGILSGGNHG